MPNRYSIATELAAIAAIVLVAVGVAVVYAVYTPHQEILKTRELQLLSAAAEEQQHRILDSIARLREDVQLLADTPPVAAIARARAAGGVDPESGDSEVVWRQRLQTIFTAFVRHRPAYSQVRLIDVGDGGYELVRVNRVGPGLVAPVSAENLQRKGDTAYWNAAAQLLRNQVYLSEVNLNREYYQVTLPRTPTIRAATSVFGHAAEPYAVIVINQDLTSLFDDLELGLPHGTGLYLTNDAGDYLVDTAGRLTFGFDLGRPRLIQDQIPELAAFYAPGSLDREFIDYGPPDHEREHENVIRLTKIHFDPADPSRYLALGLFTTHSALLADAAGIGRSSALSAGVLLLAGTMLIFLCLQRGLRPLGLFVTAADRVAGGSYDIELPPGGADEIGRLARSFRSMIGQIAERTAEVERHEHGILAANSRLDAARQDVVAKAAELEQSRQYKAEFLARISHDIRTPLNSMLILANELAGDAPGTMTSEQKDAARILAQAGSDLVILLNDLLDLSKLDAGKLEIRDAETKVAPLLERVREQFRPYAESRRLRLDVELAEGVPEAIITDPRRLRQILWNLLSNAIKFTSAGSVTLSVKLSPGAGLGSARTDDAVEFCVADTGPGIPESELGRILTPHRQINGLSRAGQAGAGLGLAIVKELVDALGGELEVASRLGVGSEFRVVFPLRSQLGQTAVKPRQPPPLPPPHSPDVRVLLVDDNAATRWTLARAFGRVAPGVVVEELEMGRQAIEAIRRVPYRSVILDYHLPDLTGIEVLRELHAGPPIYMPQIILHSGETLDQAEREEVEALSAVIVSKGGNLEALMAVARRALAHQPESGLSGRRLLIVDNDASSLFALKHALEGLGAEVEEAVDGQNAIDTLADRQDIDAVLMSLRMPVMDGHEAIRQIRANGLHQDLPVFAVTADVTEDDRRRSIAAGATAFMPKPVDPRTLASELSRHFTCPAPVLAPS